MKSYFTYAHWTSILQEAAKCQFELPQIAWCVYAYNDDS